VLEIGSGGYNAALLRELVGPDGEVTTIDIDQEIADRALSCLRTAGYRDVRVLCGDGGFGAAEYGPFDRGFVPMQGVGTNNSRSIPLHGGEANLWVGDQQVDATALSEVFSTPRVEAWSGATVRRGEIFDNLELWLARLPEFCLLSAKQDAVDRGLVSPRLAHRHFGAARPEEAAVHRPDPDLGPRPPPRPGAAPDGAPGRHPGCRVSGWAGHQ
jgi:protein-L-isoaspartate(D-aspartate) O-methyltransferase